MTNYLIDTGFWFALYSKRDAYYNCANKIKGLLDFGNILIPHPTLYETLNTRFVKDPTILSDFEHLLLKSNTVLIDDGLYKEDALKITFSQPKRDKPLSLVDIIIRMMLEDKTLKIDCLITFNTCDFIDSCIRNNVKILDGEP